jgi:hypothetical protein
LSSTNNIGSIQVRKLINIITLIVLKCVIHSVLVFFYDMKHTASTGSKKGTYHCTLHGHWTDTKKLRIHQPVVRNIWKKQTIQWVKYSSQQSGVNCKITSGASDILSGSSCYSY